MPPRSMDAKEHSELQRSSKDPFHEVTRPVPASEIRRKRKLQRQVRVVIAPSIRMNVYISYTIAVDNRGGKR